MSSTSLSRRSLLGAVGAVSAGTAVSLTTTSSAHAVRPFELVHQGVPQAVVVPREMSPDAVPQTQLDHTVQVLVDCIREATGAELPVRTQSELDADGGAGLPAGRIYLGWLGPAGSPEIAARIGELDVDGYVIAPTRSTLTIIGPSDWGTRFGVYELLEQRVGVRWLMPGPDGVDIPKRSTIVVPARVIIDEPDYKGRAFSPLFLAFTSDGLSPDAPIWTSTDPQVQWVTHNRSRPRGFSEARNLYNIFNPAIYADPAKPDTFHPEFYPIVNGETKLPARTARYHWQPRFDSQATVDHAVAYTLQYFDDHPERQVLSLTVNDGEGYSETDFDPDVYNSVGYPAASEAYFSWVNRVIDGVLRLRPDYDDKQFIVLAYFCTADAPSFALHPQAIPLISRDSHMWSDPELRPQLQQQFLDWEARATEATWFDYSSGSRFLAPRMNLRDLAAAYRWAHQHGVHYQYGDTYPELVGEGPKTWVHSKVLWNVESDVDELVDEWCNRVAGPAGGSYLRKYFDFWETFWTTAALKTSYWAFGGARTYPNFGLCGYLDEVALADVAWCRTQLEAALAAATTVAQRNRVNLIIKKFRYLEETVASYPRPVAPIVDDQGALAVVEDIASSADDRVAAAAERRRLAAELELDPVLRGRFNHDTYHFWTGFNGDAFFRLVDHLADHPDGAGQVRQRLVQVGQEASAPAAARFARMVLDVAEQRITSIVPNGSFETGGASAEPWDLRGNAERVEGTGRNGGAGLRIWSTPGVPQQRVEHDAILRVPIEAGLAASRLWFRLDGPEPRPGVMSLKFHWQTETNGNIMQCVQPTRFLSDGESEWAWISVMEDVPAEFNGREVSKLLLVGSLLAYDGATEVHWDDYEVFNEQH